MPADCSILIVDGYNIIHAWDNLKKAATKSLEHARSMLIDIMSDFATSQHKEVVIVFDGDKIGHWREEFPHSHVKVVFSSGKITADNEIERIVYNLPDKSRVLVATNDRTEQLLVSGMGARYIRAAGFQEMLADLNRTFQKDIKRYSRSIKPSLGDTLFKAQNTNQKKRSRKNN